MRFSGFNTFVIACSLVLLAENSLEELYIIQQPTKSPDPEFPYAMNYTCVAEDDRTALAFNYDLFYYNEVSRSTAKPFYPKSSSRCALVEEETCISHWESSPDWQVVNSSSYPMGPVFDSRWEDFGEMVFPDAQKFDRYVMRMQESGSVVFSTRGYGNLTIRFCRIGEQSACLDLILGYYWNGQNFSSTWTFCQPKSFDHVASCSIFNSLLVRRSKPIELLNVYLWETFILDWNKEYIRVCTDNEFKCSFGISYANFYPSQEKDIFINMGNRGLIRFHFYEYFITRTQGVTLISDKFPHNDRNLCVELTVNLCDRCTLKVYVINSKDESQAIVYISGNSRIKLFRSWQVVKLNKTLPEDFQGYLKLKIVTVLNDAQAPGQWAIDNFRKCKQGNSKRISTFIRILSRTPGSGSQPVGVCQNLRTSESISTSLPSQSFHPIISESTRQYLHENSYTVTSCPSNWWDQNLICDLSGCTCVHKTDVNISSVTVSPTSNPNPISSRARFSQLYELNVKITFYRNGVVNLNFNFLESFLKIVLTCRITVRYNHITSLKEPPSSIEEFTDFSVEFSQRVQSYNYTLELVASTGYLLFINARDQYDRIGNSSQTFETPARLGFKVDKNLEVNVTGTSLQLKLPPILNDTFDSALTVIVKGSHTCANRKLSDELRKHANITESEEAWIAVRYRANKTRSTGIITIGKPLVANNTSKFCPLHAGTYTILVLVVDEKSDVSTFICSLPIRINNVTALTTTHEKNPETLIYGWPISLFIIAVTLIFFFIWRRKVFSVAQRMCQKILNTDSQSVAYPLDSVTTVTPEQSVVPVETSTDDPISETDVLYDEIRQQQSPSSNSFKDFENYVKKSVTSGLLKYQFKTFQKGLIRPCKYGSLPENQTKNRSPDIIPYDDTRVMLKKIPGDPYSDYINASYVQGYRKKNAYIATQDPIRRTVKDFWRMIWEKEAPVICMLENEDDQNKTKCEKYWPDLGARLKYGQITIVTVRSQIFADHTLRTFQVTCGGKTRQIDHLHYTGWPDDSVPLWPHSVITCLGQLLAIPISNGPIIVHSNAGVGRTGTFILCDICLRRAATMGQIDVLAEFRKLRDCRLNMVHSEMQYVFAHIILVECLVALPTKVLCNKDFPREIELLKKQLPEQIERLRDIEWQNQALRSNAVTTKSSNQKQKGKESAREGTSVDNALSHPQRNRKQIDESLDCINAVIVDGLRVKKKYLASQLPPLSTLSDFWKLVAEQQVQLIIVLQQPDPHSVTSCGIFPPKNQCNVNPLVSVEIKTSTKIDESYINDELILTDESQGEMVKIRKMNVLTCTEWGPGKDGKPPPPEKLVEFWMASQKICREEGPTLILCHDGIAGCGLYLALSFLLEKMAVEGECDIILAVRAVRRSESNFVESQEQFEYLYDAAAKYIESFQTYANFN